MKIRKQRFLLLIAGTLFWGIVAAQNVFTVTSGLDHPSGGGLPGQLRWAVTQANAAPGESIINFNIPGTAPFSIELHATLPVITKTVIIDGTTQPGYDPAFPADPVITITGENNGMGLLANCFSFNTVQRGGVTGVFIKDFAEGIILSYCSYFEIKNNVINRVTYCPLHLIGSHFNIIKGNYINVDKTLALLPVVSTEGIFIQSSNDNVIGGMNCGEGNTIGYVNSEGIDNYSAPGQRNRYSGNRIFENSISFNPRYEILLRGGNGGILPPVISSTGCEVSGTAGANSIVELFGSTGPASLRRNARVFMGSTKANAAGQWTTPVSNVVYPYIMATATDSVNNTSELCTVSAIPLDSAKFVIKAPAVCVKEKVTFEVPGPKCTKLLSYIWDYGDGSTGSSPEHVYNAPGTYPVKLTVYDKNSCQSTYTATTNVTANICTQYDCAPCNFTLTGNGLSSVLTAPKGGSSNVINAGSIGAVVKINGGIPPYTYTWSVFTNSGAVVDWWYYSHTSPVNPMPPDMSSIYFENLGPATYTAKVVVTDASGCSAYKIFTQ